MTLLDEGSINQLKEAERLGITDQYGQKLLVKNIEIQDDWEAMVVFPGYFNSIGCGRLYYKNREINTKDKYHTPYRTYMLDVGGVKDTIVTQCVNHDDIYIKIIGTSDQLDIIEAQIRPDYKLESGLTDKDIIEANRKDLEFHKKIITTEVKFNGTPEKLDKHGQVITNLDHYDNYYYQLETTEGIIYWIYNQEEKKIRLEARLEIVEEMLDYHKHKLDRKKAIRALSQMDESDCRYILRKTWKEIDKHIEHICFETGRTMAEIWSAWRYHRIWDLEDEKEEIEYHLSRLDI